VPVCSQFSKESRWEMMQWSCNIQLQTSVEKSEERKTDCKTQLANNRNGGVGEVRSKVPRTVSDLKGLFPLAV